MKKYKLLQWYPSLGKQTKDKSVVATKQSNSNFYSLSIDNIFIMSVRDDEVENNPDFWELIEEKKPLFVTDDNIKVFDDTTEIISVSVNHHTVSNWQYRYLSKPLDCENFKHFGDEKNADEYILHHKKTFSIQDISELFDFGTDKYEELKQLAKERI